MPAVKSEIAKALTRELREAKGGLVDLMPLYVAAGHPRGKSPIMWADWTGIDPRIEVEGDGPGRRVLGGEAIARDYAHHLDRYIPRGYLGKPELKSKSWTEKLIRDFLPEPDSTRDNPHYQSAARMALYRADRVKKIERTSRFRNAFEGSARRKEGARKAVATNSRELLEQVQGLSITVLGLGREEVTRRAIDSYLASGKESVPADVARLIVNYIRHELTEYEDSLTGIRGKVGTGAAFLEVSEKVFDAIEEAYPWLAEECHRQLDERWAVS